MIDDGTRVHDPRRSDLCGSPDNGTGGDERAVADHSGRRHERPLMLHGHEFDGLELFQQRRAPKSTVTIDEADADGMGGEGAAANGSGGNGTGGAGTGGAGTGGAGTGGAGTGGSGTGGGTGAGTSVTTVATSGKGRVTPATVPTVAARVVAVARQRGSRGRPSTRSPKMFGMIADVPPMIVYAGS